MMRSLPDEEKAMISKLNEGLLFEKNRLINEVNKWEEQGNDIIVLAKRMCMIMMDMSDFTRFHFICLFHLFLSFVYFIFLFIIYFVIFRGMGPLKTTVDVIKAAEVIKYLLILALYKFSTFYFLTPNIVNFFFII